MSKLNGRKNNMHTLYCGDNLLWLKTFSDNYVDLIYLDPPFQSGKIYAMPFRGETKKKVGATAEIKAFTDTWHWGPEAEREYQGLLDGSLTKDIPSNKLITLMKAMMEFLGKSSTMAYLCMMAPRLVEMRRVLKDTGSIYLHCDPTSSHYLKLLMDSIFGGNNFRNEIVWHYRRWTAGSKKFQKMHDILLFYSKTDAYIFNKQNQPFSEKTSIARFKRKVEGGRAIQDKENLMERNPEDGISMSDVWEISFLHPVAKERMGYPTQKPELLLERIIKASSNEGDLVLDPFCGCGTTVAVAQKLNRKWIGIDVTLIAIEVIVKRLVEKEFIELEEDFDLFVWPSDNYSEESLKKMDPKGYEEWARIMKEKSPTGFFHQYDRSKVLAKLGIKEKKDEKRL